MELVGENEPDYSLPDTGDALAALPEQSLVRDERKRRRRRRKKRPPKDKG